MFPARLSLCILSSPKTKRTIFKCLTSLKFANFDFVNSSRVKIWTIITLPCGTQMVGLICQQMAEWARFHYEYAEMGTILK